MWTSLALSEHSPGCTKRSTSNEPLDTVFDIGVRLYEPATDTDVWCATGRSTWRPITLFESRSCRSLVFKRATGLRFVRHVIPNRIWALTEGPISANPWTAKEGRRSN